MDFHRSCPEAAAAGIRQRDARARRRTRRLDLPGWKSVWQDVRYARDRCPPAGFRVCAIAIVALGTGATTGVFGLLDARRQEPSGRAPHRLVWLRDPVLLLSIFREVQARLPVVEGLFGWNIARDYVDWTGGNGELVAGGHSRGHPRFFSTLRVGPCGTDLGPGRHDRRGAQPRRLETAFRRDLSASGERPCRQLPFTSSAWRPAGFFGVAPGIAPELFVPLPAGTAPRPSVAVILVAPHHGAAQGRREAEQADAALQTVWPAVLESTTTGMPPDRRAL